MYAWHIYRYLGMHICICISTCECVGVHTVCLPACEGSKLILGIFLNYSPLSLLKQGLPPELGASQLAPGVPSHASETWDYR